MPSLNLLKKIISIGFLVIALIAGYQSYFNNLPKKHNKIIAKLGMEQNMLEFILINVDETVIAQNDEQDSTVKFKITALKNILENQLNYQLKIPNDVTLTAGSLNGTISPISASNSTEYVFVFKNFSKESKKYFHFIVEGSVSGIQMRQDVLISSRIEDSFEYQYQQSEKQKQQLNQKLGLPASNGKFELGNVVK